MNWDKKTLGEIYIIEGGSVQTGPFGSQLHESDYKEFGVPVIMPKDIKNDKLDLSSISFISDDDAKRLSQHIVRKNDIVCPRRGEIGKRILIDEANIGAFCGTGCIRLRGTGAVLNQLFFFYFLKQPNVVKWIENQAIGATMMNLNTSILKSIPIKYPSLPIQQKIASILSAYDELIENNKQRIKLLEEMAEEIYKEWFVRLRFSDYENTKIVDGLPEGWERKSIDSFVNIISGYAFKTEVFDSEGIYKLVTIKNVQDGFFVTQTTDYIYELPKNLKEDCKLKDKDIILSLTGNIGRICLVYGDNYVLNQRVAKLKPKQENYFEFVYLMFLSSFLRATLENLSNGAAQQNLSPIEMGKLEFPFPSNDVISKFSELTKSFFDEIITLNKKTQLLQETRDLLLPRLISGKLSVEHLIDKNEVLLMVAEPSGEYK